jgi:hypothetical protein
MISFQSIVEATVPRMFTGLSLVWFRASNR